MQFPFICFYFSCSLHPYLPLPAPVCFPGHNKSNCTISLCVKSKQKILVSWENQRNFFYLCQPTITHISIQIVIDCKTCHWIESRFKWIYRLKLHYILHYLHHSLYSFITEKIILWYVAQEHNFSSTLKTFRWHFPPVYLLCIGTRSPNCACSCRFVPPNWCGTSRKGRIEITRTSVPTSAWVSSATHHSSRRNVILAQSVIHIARDGKYQPFMDGGGEVWLPFQAVLILQKRGSEIPQNDPAMLSSC